MGQAYVNVNLSCGEKVMGAQSPQND
jgi:hypothetical protein